MTDPVSPEELESAVTVEELAELGEPQDDELDDTADDGTGDQAVDDVSAYETVEDPAIAVGADGLTADPSGDAAANGDAEPKAPRAKKSTITLEQEGEIAADYLEELLDICDLDGDLDLDVEGDRAVVAIVGDGLTQLVGERGRVLDALQELTRLAVLASSGQRSLLMLDIGGHRAARRAELTTLGTTTAEQVVASGESQRLTAMTPFERKVVHDAVAAVAGVHSESEGEEPQRRVVVLPG